MTTGTPFPIDPVLTGVVVNYKNGDYIADRVLPRLSPILAKKEFKYSKFDFGEAITLPDTRVGRKSEPNTVEFSGTEVTASCQDYALDDLIPIDDILQAPAGYDPKSHASQRLIDLVLLDREVRVAGQVFNAATYGASNKLLLSGASQWSDALSNPIADIRDAADDLIMRPNIAVMGRLAWSALRTNPKIVSAISISGTESGNATLQAVADLLELDEIIVGEAWLNNAKPGQNVQRMRAWGSHCALLRREPLATSMSDMPTFGWTAQYGERIAGSMDEPKAGLRGAVRVRAGETVAEVISAPDLGFFFQNVAA